MIDFVHYFWHWKFCLALSGPLRQGQVHSFMGTLSINGLQRNHLCVISLILWEASDKTQPGSLDRWERKPGNEVALKAQNPHFQSNTIPDKTTWERFSLNAHCHTQQNYFQSNWIAEPNPLPPGPSCFLQTFKDQGCFTRHNNFTSKGRGEWKNRYSYDF